MVKNQEIKPQLTAQDLANAMKSSGKKQSADILSDMVSTNGSLNMKTAVNNPMIYNVMNVKSKAFIRDGYERSGALFNEIASFQKEICVSRNGDRANKVIKAIESVLAQDFEIAKSQARRMMGQK